MDKRKGLILAIVLFLIIGLGTFVFAQDEDESFDQGNGTREPSKNDGTNDNGQTTPQEQTDGESEEEGGNNRLVNNSVNNGGNQVTDNNDEIDSPAIQTVDYAALLAQLSEKVNSATNKDDLKAAEKFRVDNDITKENIANLNDEKANETFEDILAILSDNSSPIVTPEDLNGKFTNAKTVKVEIEDDTKVSYVLTIDGKEIKDADLENLNKEGTYVLTVSDSSFNEPTIVTFTIDRNETDATKTIMNVPNTTHFNNKNDAVIEITDLSLDKVIVENQDTKDSITYNAQDETLEVILNEEGTYKIYAYDKAGNETIYWLAVDTTDASITFTDSEGNVIEDISNQNVTLTVFDKFLTEVLVEGPNGDEKYTLTDGDFDKKSGENRTFTFTLTEDGVYKITAKDKVGNIVSKEITIDTVRPLLVINGKEIKATDETLYYNVDVTMTVKDDNFKLFEVNGHDRTEYAIAKGWTATGESGYKVILTDKAGNTNTYNIVVDKTIPTSNYTNGNIIKEGTLIFTDKYFDYMEVYNHVTKETSKIFENELIFSKDTEADNVRYDIIGYDKAGNATKKFNLYQDNMNPVITGSAKVGSKDVELVDNGTYKSVSLNIADGSLKQVILVNNDNEVLKTFDNNYNSSIKLEFTKEFKDNGTYEIKAIDRAGNESTIKFTIDNNKPVIKGIENGGYYQSVKITVEDDSKLGSMHLKKDGEKYNNYELGTELTEEGNYSFYITDVAGNKSETIEFTIDNTAANYNAVNFYVNGGYQNDTNYYATFGDTLVAYIRTNEELKENPTFTFTYGDKKITLSGDDVELTIEDKEEYKYLYRVKYVVNEEEFANLQDVEVKLAITNVIDKAGNTTLDNKTKEATIDVTNSNKIFMDTIAPKYETLRLTNVSRKDENGKWLQVATIGDIVRIIVSFVENPATEPTLTINGEEVGQMKYDSQMKSYTYDYKVNENTKNGLMQIEVSEYADVVGNVGVTLTNEDITNNEQNEMLVDTINPEVVFASTHNYNKYYDLDKLAITIKDANLKEVYYTWSNTNKYVNATTKIDSENIINNEDGTYTINIPTIEGRNRLHIRAIDVAGNETTAYSSKGAYNIDKTDPEITLYYWFGDGNHKVIEPSVHNYCVFAEATDANMKSITLNGQEYTNGELICDTDKYELKAVDKANHEVSINFEIDRTYGSIFINDKDEYNTYDIKTLHKYQKIENIKFSESGTVRLSKNDQIVYFGNDADFAYDFTDGVYKLELIDKGGNNTVVMFEVDGTAPQVKELRINSSNENKQYANETHSVGIYLTVDEKLAKDPVFTINGVQYKLTEQKEVTKGYFYATTTKLPEETKEGELEFSIDVEDEFGNPATFTNADILNDVGYDKVIFDTTDPELILAGIEETYDNVLRIESGTPKTLEDITAKAIDASFDEEVSVKPYKVEFYDNTGKQEDNDYDYDFSNGLDTRKPSGSRYNVYYEVTDKAGNTTKDVMLVMMSDTTNPNVTINGPHDVNVELGSEYTDLGATMTDNVDATINNLKPSAIKYYTLGMTFIENVDTGIVDTNREGRYLLYYDYTDASGNSSLINGSHSLTQTRWVIVKDTTVQ